MTVSRKYILLDTNVLINYYTEDNKNVVKIMNLLTSTLSKSVTLFIPNFCVAEMFKILTSECFYKEKIGKDKFLELKQKFIEDISRDYKFKRLQKYVHLELNRYHLFSANLVYQPSMEFLRKYHKKYPPLKKKHLSTFDLLVIAQGIELGRIHGYENFCILTSDELMYKIGNYLRHIKLDKEYVKLKDDSDEGYQYLKYFRYPLILRATNKPVIFKFLDREYKERKK